MPRSVFSVGLAAFAAAVCWFATASSGMRGAAAQMGGIVPISVEVDATQARQKMYHVKVTMPAHPGAFTFVYPRWIPGWHSPSGPISNVVSMHVFASGREISWRRDLVDFFAIHTDLPAGAGSLRVDFDVVGAPPTLADLLIPSTENLAIVQWNAMLMYPEGALADVQPVVAKLRLPSGWSFGTALPVRSRSGDVVSFEQVSLTTLVDSPLVTGRYFRSVPLGGEHELDIAADSAAALGYSRQFLTGMRHLVAEGPALYGTKHYRNYHFLLTLTDSFDPNGIEHHESSDNRAVEKYLTDPQLFRTFADLLPHEFSHSWNGKYRRPADLLVDDFQKPERTDLLWVYEGLNQYVGELLQTRSHLLGYRDQLDSLAISAANMDVESGRKWRPIRDLADEAPVAYSAPGAYYELRRNGGDFYTECNLIWLEADVTIRRLSGGKRSLDDFLKLWASGGSTTPSVKTYTLDDVVTTLNAIQPYDWKDFLDERIAKVQPRAPLGGIKAAGWRLAYGDTASELFRANEVAAKQADFRFSLGIVVWTDADKDGTIKDLVIESPAYAAGLAPGMKIVAVDGRKWSADLLRQALRDAKANRKPLELIVSNGDFFRVVRVPYHRGERYPRLERIAGTPDLLARIYSPLTFRPSPEPTPARR